MANDSANDINWTSGTTTAAGLMQSLIRRNPAYTREQFSAHWLRHARLVLPYCLAAGVTYYAQIHNPIVSPSTPSSPPADLDLSEWDGAAEMGFAAVSEGGEQASVSPESRKALEAKAAAYYQNVVLPDERKLLESEALKHLRRIDPGTVTGEKVIIIENGEACVDYEEERKAWEAFSP